MCQQSYTSHAKLIKQVKGGIEAWESKGRWDAIWMAGLRDEDPPTIFDKIVNNEIPASIVHNDDKVLAFKDINPAAPAHLLVIPKDRMNLSGIRKSSPEHIEILGRLLVIAGKLANSEEHGFADGARIVINDGPDGGQGKCFLEKCRVNPFQHRPPNFPHINIILALTCLPIIKRYPIYTSMYWEGVH